MVGTMVLVKRRGIKKKKEEEEEGTSSYVVTAVVVSCVDCEHLLPDGCIFKRNQLFVARLWVEYWGVIVPVNH